MEKPLTFWDRIVYGAISAGFGVLLGLGASLCLVFVVSGTLPVRWIVLASGIYFFAVGIVRGPEAALLTGEAATAVAGAALAETGAYPGAVGNSNDRWSTWSSPYLLCIWIAIVGLVTWRA